MRTFFTLLAMLIFSNSIIAQNLVINPSFENYSSCPLGPSEFENANNWTHPFINVIGDTCSTSDLYSTCSPFGALGVGVPDNIMGSEAAHTGNSYAGFIAYEGFTAFGCTSLFGSNWREYVQGELSSPLQAGQTYCVSFWISLADNVKWSTRCLSIKHTTGISMCQCWQFSTTSCASIATQWWRYRQHKWLGRTFLGIHSSGWWTVHHNWKFQRW